jgi:chromosome segregation ATPase
MEIESQKRVINEKNEMLQKFHRGTVEVIKQNENLSQELSSLQSAHETMVEEKTLLEQLNSELNSQIKLFEERVTRNGHDLTEAHETIDKLQIKCANLIKEKQELLRRQESETEEWTHKEERSQVSQPAASLAGFLTSSSSLHCTSIE